MSRARCAAPEYEVAVVGGGAIGGTLAALFGGAGLRTALIEGTEPLPSALEPDPVDARVLALTRSSERVLRAISAWHHIEAGKPGVFRDMHVWDAGGHGSIHFDSAEVGEPMLGHIVRNRVLESSLETVLRHLPLVTWHRPARLASLDIEPDRVVLVLEGSLRFSALLLVGADGAGSSVRSLAGIENRVWDYHQSALICTVLTEKAHAQTARQRFLPAGPLAFLPLVEPHRSAIVWSTSCPEVEALLTCRDEEFAHRLRKASDSVLGAIIEVGPRTTFPLARAHATRYVGSRIALVGDAAHRIHPLAGLGANLGLLDAATLAEVVLEARQRGRDIGALRVLRRFERWRKGENLAVMWLMDAFKGLFETAWEPLRVARNLGLALTDAATPVKRLIMLRAMGLEGDLPQIARGERR